MFKKELNFILANKKLFFKFKNSKICEKIKIGYYMKKDTRPFFKNARHKDLYQVMVKFENIFGLIPFVKKINVKLKNKKKKNFL